MLYSVSNVGKPQLCAFRCPKHAKHSGLTSKNITMIPRKTGQLQSQAMLSHSRGKPSEAPFAYSARVQTLTAERQVLDERIARHGREAAQAQANGAAVGGGPMDVDMETPEMPRKRARTEAGEGLPCSCKRRLQECRPQELEHHKRSKASETSLRQDLERERMFSESFVQVGGMVGKLTLKDSCSKQQKRPPPVPVANLAPPSLREQISVRNAQFVCVRCAAVCKRDFVVLQPERPHQQRQSPQRPRKAGLMPPRKRSPS